MKIKITFIVLLSLIFSTKNNAPDLKPMNACLDVAMVCASVLAVLIAQNKVELLSNKNISISSKILYSLFISLLSSKYLKDSKLSKLYSIFFYLYFAKRVSYSNILSSHSGILKTFGNVAAFMNFLDLGFDFVKNNFCLDDFFSFISGVQSSFLSHDNEDRQQPSRGVKRYRVDNSSIV